MAMVVAAVTTAMLTPHSSHHHRLLLLETADGVQEGQYTEVEAIVDIKVATAVAVAVLGVVLVAEAEIEKRRKSKRRKTVECHRGAGNEHHHLGRRALVGATMAAYGGVEGIEGGAKLPECWGSFQGMEQFIMNCLQDFLHA